MVSPQETFSGAKIKPETPVLDREFLEIRALILQLAAALDRVDRNDKTSNDDLRMERICAGLKVVAERDGAIGDRAAKVQLIFSHPYDAHWRTQFEL